MLVVVEDRDVEGLDEARLDLEALGRPDVLEVDAAEGRRDQLAELDDLFGVVARDLDVEDVDVGEALEEDALAFHHRLAGERADVAEPEHRGAVADHRDEIGLGGVAVDGVGVLGDLAAGLGDPGRVGEREVVGRERWLGWDDLDLSGPPRLVIGQRLFPCDRPLQFFPRRARTRARSLSDRASARRAVIPSQIREFADSRAYSLSSSRAITSRWIWLVPS